MPITRAALKNCATAEGAESRFARLKQRCVSDLRPYEDTGLEPEAVETVKIALCAKHMVDLETLNNTPISRLVELAVADQEGRVTILPCRGDANIVLMRNGVAFKPDHWNIHLTTFAENQPTPSGKKVALFDLREVRESMEDKG